MKQKLYCICLAISFITLTLFLSACAETPQSVKDEVDAYNAIQTNIAETMSLPFEEVINSTETTYQNTGQFILNDITVKLPLCEAKAYNFELNYKSCVPEEEIKRIAADQFPDITLDAVSDESKTKVYYANQASGFYCDGQNMIRVEGASGYTRLLHGASLEYCNFINSEDYVNYGINALSVWDPSDFFPAEKIISLHSGESVNSELSYELSNGSVKVIEAMEFAQSYLDNIFSAYEYNQFTYKIRKVYIRKISENKYGYEFSAERYYNGIPIDSTPLYNYKGADFGSTGYFVENGDPIYIWMIDACSIDYFFCGARRQVNNIQVGYDNILTLDSAFSILSNSLTSYTTFNVNSVELIYINGYYADTPLQMYTDEDIINYVKYPKKTRLVWAVLIDMTSANPGTLEYPHDPHYSLFVDAVTGEMIGYYNKQEEYVY